MWLPWWISHKESAGSAENKGDTGLIPGSGRFPGGGNGNYSSILAWKIPWTEEPGGLSSEGSKRVGHDWATEHIIIILVFLAKKIINSGTDDMRIEGKELKIGQDN